jgi:hypothetical protein
MIGSESPSFTARRREGVAQVMKPEALQPSRLADCGPRVLDVNENDFGITAILATDDVASPTCRTLGPQRGPPVEALDAIAQACAEKMLRLKWACIARDLEACKR